MQQQNIVRVVLWMTGTLLSSIFNPGTVVVVRTASGRTFKLGNPSETATTFSFDVVELH